MDSHRGYPSKVPTPRLGVDERLGQVGSQGKEFRMQIGEVGGFYIKFSDDFPEPLKRLGSFMVAIK